MINKYTTGFFLYFFRAFPKQTTAMIILLILAGFAEGLGVVTLLPLLEVAQQEGSAARSGIGRVVVELFDVVGLQPSIAPLLGFMVLTITAKAVFMWLAT